MVDLEAGKRWRWGFVGVVGLIALVGLGLVLQRACAPRIKDVYEFVVKSCDRDAMQTFDFSWTRTSSWHDSDEIEQDFAADVQVSGSDFYMIMEWVEDESEYESELIDIGFEKFFRSPEDPNYPNWLDVSHDAFFPIRIHPYAYGTVRNYRLPVDLCPDFVSAGAQIQGRTTVGSVEILRLRDTLEYVYEDEERVNEETGETETYDLVLTDIWQFWIDDTGMLVKTLQEADRETYTAWSVTEISGVGEPNVITRPATSTVVLSE